MLVLSVRCVTFRNRSIQDWNDIPETAMHVNFTTVCGNCLIFQNVISLISCMETAFSGTFNESLMVEDAVIISSDLPDQCLHPWSLQYPPKVPQSVG